MPLLVNLLTGRLNVAASLASLSSFGVAKCAALVRSVFLPARFSFFSVGNAEPLAASISSHPVWTKLLPIAVSLHVQIQSRFFSGTSANVCRFLMADGDEKFPFTL